MQSKYKVVVLPTDEASTLHIQNNVLQTGILRVRKRLMNNYNVHLYIVATEATIEVGDWFVENNSLQKSKFGKHHTQVEGYHLKVIASTDVSLGLPLVTDVLIKDYINNSDIVLNNMTVTPNGYAVFDYDDKDYSSLVDLRMEELYYEPQVDFQLVKEFINCIEGYIQDAPYKYQADRFRNLQDFFYWLGKDYDFAIKAHYALMTSDAK